MRQGEAFESAVCAFDGCERLNDRRSDSDISKESGP